MKKILFAILLLVGFIMAASESATTTPNVIGLGLFFYSIYKLGAFNDPKTEP